MAGLDLDLRGLIENERALKAIAVGLRDLRGLWPRIVPLFIGFERQQFETEGAAGGSPWAPLSAAYAAEKARTHPGRSILIRGGALRGAASRPSRQVTPTTMTLTIDDEKAPYHQTGTTRMPARPLVPGTMPATFDAAVRVAMDDYVTALIQRATR